MNDLESKSNNDILLEIKQIEADHEALKLIMLKDLDRLFELEARFERANQIILNRLKGTNA
jgi:hypothetical protein